MAAPDYSAYPDILANPVNPDDYANYQFEQVLRATLEHVDPAGNVSSKPYYLEYEVSQIVRDPDPNPAAVGGEFFWCQFWSFLRQESRRWANIRERSDAPGTSFDLQGEQVTQYADAPELWTQALVSVFSASGQAAARLGNSDIGRYGWVIFGRNGFWERPQFVSSGLQTLYPLGGVADAISVWVDQGVDAHCDLIPLAPNNVAFKAVPSEQFFFQLSDWVV